MVPYKVYVFFYVDQKYTKETKGPKVSKRVCPYIFVFDEDFFNAFLKENNLTVFFLHIGGQREREGLKILNIFNFIHF